MEPAAPPPPRRRKAYVPAISPRLRRVLFVVFGLFALLGANSLYLAGITVLEQLSGQTYQDYFYQLMFLGHLVLGLLIIVPVLVFGIRHLSIAWHRPNRRAVRAGIALFTTILILLASGIVLTRFDFFEVRDPRIRNIGYWLHVTSPLLVCWLFVLHRLAGPRLRWRAGGTWAGFTVAVVVLMVGVQAQDPRSWNVTGPVEGETYFFPSLARTATGDFIPANTLMMDAYCQECHGDVHEQWQHSVHRFSSFNNPAYLFSVRNTREVALQRDGDVRASRFCAGCHDPVPFFSGAFDDPKFDDVNHATANAGITCTACHAITNINSVRGNADYTIEEPLHYPFTFSEHAPLRWINRQILKAKPEFHKKTFLKPLHKTPEYCGACHKVHLPEELNHYKWLRGQNHYDSYHLSGVSGHGVSSFYYPPRAEDNCNGCHMPLTESDDFGAADFDGSGELKVHEHLFPSANTAIPYLTDMPSSVIDRHREFLDGVMRVDIFGLRDDGRIDGTLIAPLRPSLPTLVPGKRYLLEIVVRTVDIGHPFTQGTADSNEVWLDVVATSGGEIIGRSGGLEASTGAVDPWSHFVNAYVLDRNGNRIDRRNAEDIFVALYDHQIPPGAADVVHYLLDVPTNISGPISVEARLKYRKFDTTYVRHFQGDNFTTNDLPITTLATDKVSLPVGSTPERRLPAVAPATSDWERWNDYGIGLLRKPEKRQLRQAEEAFTEVAKLGRADGDLNLARVYLAEGRLDDSAAALRRAATHDQPAYPWVTAWLSGLVDKQNGYLDEAIATFEQIIDSRYDEARTRGFDFSQDYRLLNELGKTLFDRAKRERGNAQRSSREQFVARARQLFLDTLKLDPENVTAHYNLGLIYRELGDEENALLHRQLHARYKPDDNARDLAASAHRRRNPAANHAADAVVIYDLHRAGAYGYGDATDTGANAADER
jgi:tetratricopeptide (TPR) repeat protein